MRNVKKATNEISDIKKEFLEKDTRPSNKELLHILLSYVFQGEDCEKATEELYRKLFIEGKAFRDVASKLYSVNCTEEQEIFIKAVLSLLNVSATLESKQINSHSEGGEFCRSFIGISSTEGMYMISLTEENRVISFEQIAAGDAGSVFIYIDAMVERAVSLKAKKVIVAHNHTGRYLKCSLEDYYATEKLGAYFSKKNIILMEHFVVNAERYQGILYDLTGKDNWKA